MIPTAIQNALDKIGITSIFAKIDQANFGLDKIPTADFPVAVWVLPITQSSEWQQSGAARRGVEIQVLFLARTPDVDPTTEVAYQLIDDMTSKAESFWVNLQAEQAVMIIDTANHDTLWAVFDSALYGVASQASVDFLNKDLSC